MKQVGAGEFPKSIGGVNHLLANLTQRDTNEDSSVTLSYTKCSLLECQYFFKWITTLWDVLLSLTVGNLNRVF